MFIFNGTHQSLTKIDEQKNKIDSFQQKFSILILYTYF